MLMGRSRRERVGLVLQLVTRFFAFFLETRLDFRRVGRGCGSIQRCEGAQYRNVDAAFKTLSGVIGCKIISLLIIGDGRDYSYSGGKSNSIKHREP